MLRQISERRCKNEVRGASPRVFKSSFIFWPGSSFVVGVIITATRGMRARMSHLFTYSAGLGKGILLIATTKILRDWNFLSRGRVRNTNSSDILGSLVGNTTTWRDWKDNSVMEGDIDFWSAYNGNIYPWNQAPSVGMTEKTGSPSIVSLRAPWRMWLWKWFKLMG